MFPLQAVKVEIAFDHGPRLTEAVIVLEKDSFAMGTAQQALAIDADLAVSFHQPPGKGFAGPALVGD